MKTSYLSCIIYTLIQDKPLPDQSFVDFNLKH